MIPKKILLYLFTFLGIILVFYFSWLPNPDIGYQSYFPTWLGKWTNQNANLRTAVPFIFLGFIGMWLPIFKHGSQSKKAAWIVLILLGIVTIAEIGQLYQPKRHFDLADIGWGFAGSVLGILLTMFVQKLLKK